MGVNLMQSGRKMYSVPAAAGVLKGSIREVLADDARMIEMVIRNLDEVNSVTLKPLASDSKAVVVTDTLDATAVGASYQLGTTQHDQVVIAPLGRATLRFSVGTRYWALYGSGGPALIEVHESAQNWSPVEGHGSQSGEFDTSTQ
jgi:hypothetical protein